jgi:hypothetical protein
VLARDTGAGRALIEAREAAARDMGLTRLIANTLTPNVEMRSLYPKLGFTEVDGPIETMAFIDQPMLRPHLHYFFKEPQTAYETAAMVSGLSWLPSASKFHGASQRSNSALAVGHSRSRIENHAVSRLRSL